MITGSVAGMDCIDSDALNTFGRVLTSFFFSPSWIMLHHGRRTMGKPSNERLCVLVQKGDTYAANLLLECN